MTEVAATEFARNFGRYREAAQHEPIAVTSHDRVTGYFVSAREFEEYRRLKARASQAIWAGELDNELLAALDEAKMDANHAHLDAADDAE